MSILLRHHNHGTSVRVVGVNSLAENRPEWAFGLGRHQKHSDRIRVFLGREFDAVVVSVSEACSEEQFLAVANEISYLVSVEADFSQKALERFADRTAAISRQSDF